MAQNIMSAVYKGWMGWIRSQVMGFIAAFLDTMSLYGCLAVKWLALQDFVINSCVNINTHKIVFVGRVLYSCNLQAF